MPEAALSLAPTASIVLELEAASASSLSLQPAGAVLELAGSGGSSTIELLPGADLVLTPTTPTLEIDHEAQEVALLLMPILRGPQGVAGGDGTVQRTAIASVTLSGHRAVYLAGGEAAYASADDAATANACIGITTGAALEGDEVVITTMGKLVEPTWTWTEALPVYLGLNGLLTQTVPTSGCLVELGIATTATELEVRIQSPINLI